MSNFVFVVDSNKTPISPCHPSVARKLLRDNKAAIFRRYPFTIILKKEVSNSEPKPIQLKIDPGSRTTGIALVQNDKVIWGAELAHRGQQIKDALLSRRQLRRSRRNRKTRYRQARFLNRTRPQGCIAPSLQHRVETTLTWVNKLLKFAPITGISTELVRFDTQTIQTPEISGVQYQQGELAGYEVREYLLEKWERQCVYCNVKDVPLEVEHIVARSKGGSDRVSNLTIACKKCNQSKGNQDIKDFLSSKPSWLNKVLKQAKQPLKDAAAVNSTRWALFNRLKETGLPVETGTGGRTKYNRCRLGLSKTHWVDAACVGKVEVLQLLTKQPLLIKATGHGNRQMCGTDKYGFPIRHRTNQKIWFGFQTGDIVEAKIPKGKFTGTWVGRILVRSRPSFKLNSTKIFDVHPKHLKAIHKSDGYNYAF